MKRNLITTEIASISSIIKARHLFTTGAITLSMLATLGTAVLWDTDANLAHAQTNADRFDISDVLVEESESGQVRAQDVALDPAGNRYVLGNFTGTVLFGEGRSAQELEGTNGDFFVAKYDTDDNLIWVQKFDVFVSQTQLFTQPTGIKFDDKFGNIFIVGVFGGRLVIGSQSLVSDINANGFVAQLDPETGEAKWANQIASDRLVTVSDLSTNGNLAVTGAFNGIADFQGQSNSGKSLLALSPNDSDMYTAIYAFDGSVDFVLQAGGDEAEGTSVDFGPGTIHVGGDFLGTIQFPDRTGQQPTELTSSGKTDGFVVSYTTSGQERFVTQFGGTQSDSVRQVVNKGFHVYAAGNFRDEASIGETALTSRGETDIFIAQINRFNGLVQTVTQAGGRKKDFIHNLDADTSKKVGGAIFIGGEFFSQSMVIGKDSATVVIKDPNDNPLKDATFLAGLSVDNDQIQPSFGQAVEGEFVSRNLTVDDGGENLFFPGRFSTAVAFGEGARKIELPSPSGQSAMAVAHFVPATDEGSEASIFHLSSSSSGNVDGIDFRDEDVLAFSPQRQRWTMLIDGSDIGLGSVDIDAFHGRSDGTMLLSVDKPVSLPRVGEVDDSDILLFTPEQLGKVTTGTLRMFLRGADAGLTTNGEDIDAITSDTEGRLVISTLGKANVPGRNGALSAQDEDLLVHNGNVWELLFDGSDIGLELSTEDVKGASVDASGSMAFTTLGSFKIDGLSGDADDLVNCELTGTGENTTVSECALLFDSGANGMANEVVDALSIVRVAAGGTAATK
ncbi:hypothetical protein [Halomonas sp. M20]|uniref:hypothetical protein n=1 Tax=Halomonas sp. M20 TaxID=2763264 RepID=UPI001D09BAC0|nr:hypothetical protein [Halomonas sp. M20]